MQKTNDPTLCGRCIAHNLKYRFWHKYQAFLKGNRARQIEEKRILTGSQFTDKRFQYDETD